MNEVEYSYPSKTIGKRKFVLSNASNSFLKSHPSVFSHVVLKKNLVLGFLEKKGLEVEPKKLVPIWKKLKKNNKNRKLVLLYSGSNKKLLTLGKLKLFDLIISSNTKDKDEKLIYDEDKKDYLLIRQFDELQVKMVPMLGKRGFNK